MIIWRAPRPYGASPTQPFNAVGMLKSKSKSKNLSARVDWTTFLRQNLSVQADWTDFYAKISPRRSIGHIFTSKSLRAGRLDTFSRQNLSARVDWTHFYVKISPFRLIEHIFTSKSLRAGWIGHIFTSKSLREA